MKKVLKSLLGLLMIIEISGCAPSQEQLLLEKQKKEAAAKLKEEKYKEAKKYLNLNNDNSLIWDIIENNKDKFKTTIYESSAEYKNRIKNLNLKLFNRNFIFDYKPDILSYSADSQVLFLPFHMQERGSQILLAGKNKTDLGYGYSHPTKKYILVHSNLQYNIYSHSQYDKYKGKEYMSVVFKKKCSGLEAKKIQNSWKIRFVTNIRDNSGRVISQKNKSNLIDSYYGLGKIKMIIVYNKYTKEIYKVFY